MKFDPTKIAVHQHHSFDIAIGTKMSLKGSPAEKAVWTILVGMEKNRYILLRLPRELSDSTATGSLMTVKYVDRHLIFGFSATILQTIRSPFPLLFLEYPNSVETLNLRYYDRAICFLPTTIYLEDKEIPVHIIDLSRGGCLIAADPDLAGPLSALEKGASFFSQFILDGPDTFYVRCEIRNMNTERQKLLLGLKFIDLPEESEQQIGGYVKQINEFHSG
jgi:c-di-GMP-binding flagellar brake protein YcgR